MIIDFYLIDSVWLIYIGHIIDRVAFVMESYSSSLDCGFQSNTRVNRALGSEDADETGLEWMLGGFLTICRFEKNEGSGSGQLRLFLFVQSALKRSLSFVKT